VDGAALDELRSKYVEILRLREEELEGGEGDPRRAMRALADRFPGALREVDDLPLATIRARIDALAAAAVDRSRIEPWMEAMALFHPLARGALAAKRWLHGKRTVDPATRSAFREASREMQHGADARRWENDLPRLAKPPRGRVTEAVLERVGSALGISARDAHFLVFGIRRRDRRG